jgi:chemotaxis protein MotB
VTLRRNFRQRSSNAVMNYWPSMVDIMSSSALILFFVMALIATLSYYRSMEYKKISEENEELINEQRELLEANANLMAEQKQLLDDIQTIITKREEMYEKLLTELNNRLGQGKVKRDETRLYVDAETLFEFDQWVLKTDGMNLARVMGNVFCQIIKEQQNSADNTIKITSIEVIGHADNKGTESRNRLVSAQRSGVFVDYMLSEMSRADVQKYGCYFKSSSMSKYAPVTGTVEVQSDSERAKNRRIEFIINFSDEDFSYLLEKYAGK